MPPGRTRSAAARSSSSWSSGSGSARQRRSGRPASTPRPEHGASTSARSKPSSSGGSAVPSASTTVTSARPILARFSRSSRARAGSISTAVTSPRSCPVLPPGAAQRSSTRSPSCEPTQRPASCEPRLCGQVLPSATSASSTRSTRYAPGTSVSSAPDPGSPRTSRTTVSSGSFIARMRASAPSSPSTRTKTSWIQSGYDSFSGPSGSDSRSGPIPSESRRITAFVNGTARSSRARRTSSTDSLTAACAAVSL